MAKMRFVIKGDSVAELMQAMRDLVLGEVFPVEALPPPNRSYANQKVPTPEGTQNRQLSLWPSGY